MLRDPLTVIGGQSLLVDDVSKAAVICPRAYSRAPAGKQRAIRQRYKHWAQALRIKETEAVKQAILVT